MAESIQEGTLQKWNKALNDFVDADELVASIETDKVVVEVRAPESGVLAEQHAQENATVRVGDPLFSLNPQTAASEKAPEKKEKEVPEKKTEKQEKKAQESQPTPEKKAEKSAENKVEEPKSSAPNAPSKPAPQTPLPTPSSSSPTKTSSDSSSRIERRVPMNRMRLRIAERLKSAQNTYALLTTFQEVDMKNLTQLRADFKDEFLKKHGVKLGFMSAFVKAATVALLDQPIVNAVIADNDIIYRDFVDISVAVATPRGLVVPVLRNCEKMGFADVEREINELGERARNGQLTIEDMTGGTFTISNGGVYGSLMGTPIINPPQSGILGMHSIVKRPVVVDERNTIEVRPMMYIALTYDHRLIDGREAVTFLKKIKSGIEDPRRFLLDL